MFPRARRAPAKAPRSGAVQFKTKKPRNSCGCFSGFLKTAPKAISPKSLRPPGGPLVELKENPRASLLPPGAPRAPTDCCSLWRAPGAPTDRCSLWRGPRGPYGLLQPLEEPQGPLSYSNKAASRGPTAAQCGAPQPLETPRGPSGGTPAAELSSPVPHG